jgi:RNA polymerase sigma-70 factor, ECF subfamily
MGERLDAKDVCNVGCAEGLQAIEIREVSLTSGRRVANQPYDNPRLDPATLLRKLQLRLDSLYAESRAAEWSLSAAQFAAALERSICKRFASVALTQQALEEYLESLHIEDLVLASACMAGSEPAWECFVGEYRGYLRAAAGAITKGSRSGTDAQELADSLFAELFGLADGKRGEASLLRYFHGRSSLKTWLRTVLAQRHIDALRRSRRWESLEQDDGEEKPLPPDKVTVPAVDPHRAEYLRRFLVVLTTCLETLPAQERQLLELYYARDKTLAQIGRLLGEHESSVSRQLERARRDLRARVEELLRTGCPLDGHARKFPPMSDPEIALCFEYAAEDAPIDFRQIFPEKVPRRSETGRKESS